MPLFFFNKLGKLTKKDKPQKTGKNKVGLALGGGGARGFAHIGVLKAFEEASISFDMVSGTSVGSLVGAAYCYGLSAEDLIDFSHNLEVRDIKNRNLFFQSDASNIGNLIKQIMGDITFSDLNCPFYVVTVDMKSASEVIINSGSVASAVSASCAVPLVFSPVVRGNYHLMDGGLLNNIPSDVLKVRGADRIVAVDINHSRGEGTNSLKLFDIMRSTYRIMSSNSSIKGLLAADLVVAPDTKRFSPSKKEGYMEMIDEGYKSAMDLMPEIKRLFD